MTAKTMEELVSLCKRRGFLFQSNDIYGGIKGLYDYGPMGVEFKNNLKQAWWKSMVYERDDTEGLDASILSSPVVLKHSGHEDTFTDPLVDCRACKSRWRADQLLENNKCPNCKSEDLTEPRPFNLMFKTAIGPVDDGSSFAYLRPETCQQIFTNFKNILDSTSRTVPFGIAQMGKAFRNEITPRNFIFRVREFEQMELEFFVKPGTDDEWHEYWINKRIEWWVNQGIKKENLKKIEVEKNELAHYSKRTVDINYVFPHGEEELEGVANRTDFDLGSHTKNQNDFKITSEVMKNSSSTTKLAIQDLEEKKWYIPYVIEPSAGVDRGVLALLNEAYREENVDKDNKRILLSLKPHLSPIKAAVIPLKKNNDEFVVASGGKGGFGNTKFKSSTNRAPKKFTKGIKGEEFWIWLQLKTIADIGIIGLPNAGKSSLLASMTSATPKIANYKFTTLNPNLGVAVYDDKEITLADIPGLIEGAHSGVGLGIKFLKHIERCKTLLHLIDINEEDLVSSYKQVRNELKSYGKELIKKKEIIVFNKIDLLQKNNIDKKVKDFEIKIKKKTFKMSTIQSKSVSNIKSKLINYVS